MYVLGLALPPLDTIEATSVGAQQILELRRDTLSSGRNLLRVHKNENTCWTEVYVMRQSPGAAQVPVIIHSSDKPPQHTPPWKHQEEHNMRPSTKMLPSASKEESLCGLLVELKKRREQT